MSKLAIAQANEPVEDIDLEDDTASRLKRTARERAWTRLKLAVQTFKALDAEGKVYPTLVSKRGSKEPEKRYLQWEKVERAYRAFRGCYVEYRDRRGPLTERGWVPKGVKDPGLQAWADSIGMYQRHFFGPGANPEVKEVLGTYFKLRNKWHPKADPKYRAWKTKYQRNYMRKRRAAAKEAKRNGLP